MRLRHVSSTDPCVMTDAIMADCNARVVRIEGQAEEWNGELTTTCRQVGSSTICTNAPLHGHEIYAKVTACNTVGKCSSGLSVGVAWDSAPPTVQLKLWEPLLEDYGTKATTFTASTGRVRFSATIGDNSGVKLDHTTHTGGSMRAIDAFK